VSPARDERLEDALVLEDVGGRPVIEANPHEVVQVEAGDELQLADVDTWEDWQRTCFVNTPDGQ